MFDLVLIGGGLTLGYFWLTGHWYAAVIVGLPLSLIGLGAEDPLIRPIVCAVGAAIGAAPWFIRRCLEKGAAAQALEQQILAARWEMEQQAETARRTWETTPPRLLLTGGRQ
jgi:hypothetical protein